MWYIGGAASGTGANEQVMCCRKKVKKGQATGEARGAAVVVTLRKGSTCSGGEVVNRLQHAGKGSALLSASVSRVWSELSLTIFFAATLSLHTRRARGPGFGFPEENPERYGSLMPNASNPMKTGMMQAMVIFREEMNVIMRTEDVLGIRVRNKNYTRNRQLSTYHDTNKNGTFIFAPCIIHPCRELWPMA